MMSPLFLSPMEWLCACIVLKVIERRRTFNAHSKRHFGNDGMHQKIGGGIGKRRGATIQFLTRANLPNTICCSKIKMWDFLKKSSSLFGIELNWPSFAEKVFCGPFLLCFTVARQVSLPSPHTLPFSLYQIQMQNPKVGFLVPL